MCTPHIGAEHLQIQIAVVIDDIIITQLELNTVAIMPYDSHRKTTRKIESLNFAKKCTHSLLLRRCVVI